MSEAHPILEDHECVHCYYNLRGLTLAHNCPECGRPVVESVRLVMTASPPQTAEQAAAVADMGARLWRAVKGSGYPVEAFSFVIGALRYAFRARPDGVDARDVCQAVREYAAVRLGGTSGAIARLAEWNIRRSEDVGRIIFRMVDTGRIQASPGDSPEQFEGLFTLEDLFGGGAGEAAQGAARPLAQQPAQPE